MPILQKASSARGLVKRYNNTMSGLKHKKVKGRVRVLKVARYRDHQVYIRMIGKDYFEYILPHDGEIYSSYIIIEPRKGKDKLTKAEVAQCMDLIYSGAEATIDSLVGVELVGTEKERAEAVVGVLNELVKKEEDALQK